MEAILDQHRMTVLVGNGEEGNMLAILPAYHYDDTLDNRSEFTKQCWIPAKPETNFCIRYCWNGAASTALKKKAGLFCTLYIDELIVERAYLPLKGINKTGKNREWEISGKYYRGPDGPVERPFTFTETPIDDDADVLDTSKRGTIRVVLHWATPDPDVEHSRDLSKEAADTLALELETAVSSDNYRFQACVGLGVPEPSGVKENNMKVRPIDNKKYTFIFHYAHPDWLVNEGIIPPMVLSNFRTQANT
ncbi:unnamed protein product [Rhizoctonia solani]|uniref:DUF7918 domain-containing protein n=1 Tax=Rhizoctonia solani TaxID=456999 RepID=A0A8H3GM86_9AGAM|nr:unnamed protein product [Rhizoctonia solani]